ncbi:hypothetical protein [Variovorax sp. UC74_104]|uniref:hypothetical protein n=1 Tax=Variovorax sp. UC74_104 TaxID=3374555 RepID=UPI00375644FC
MNRERHFQLAGILGDPLRLGLEWIVESGIDARIQLLIKPMHFFRGVPGIELGVREHGNREAGYFLGWSAGCRGRRCAGGRARWRAARSRGRKWKCAGAIAAATAAAGQRGRRHARERACQHQFQQFAAPVFRHASQLMEIDIFVVEGNVFFHGI